MVYGAPDLASFLDYGGPDASLHLTRQLVATKLNLLNGTDAAIQPVVTSADGFLSNFPPGSNPKGQDKQQGNDLASQLDTYNTQPCE